MHTHIHILYTELVSEEKFNAALSLKLLIQAYWAHFNEMIADPITND